MKLAGKEMYLSSKQAWLLSILLMAQKTLEEPCKCFLNLIVTSSQTVPEKLQEFVLNLTVHKLSMAELDLQFFLSAKPKCYNSKQWKTAKECLDD